MLYLHQKTIGIVWANYSWAIVSSLSVQIFMIFFIYKLDIKTIRREDARDTKYASRIAWEYHVAPV